MKTGFAVGILGAGLGSRLAAAAHAKPLAKLEGISLVARLETQFSQLGAEKITLALRDELISAADRAALPAGEKIEYLFVNTESSLHTLGALVNHMRSLAKPVVFSMVDTVLRDEDLRAFWNFCEKLAEDECAVLVTKFVADEKPLWVQVDEEGYVEKFGSEPGPFVTSGVYFLSPTAMELAPRSIENGMHKMRNFLSNLLTHEIPVKTFVVEKTIDVDHPSDLELAAQFLRGTKGPSS